MRNVYAGNRGIIKDFTYNHQGGILKEEKRAEEIEKEKENCQKDNHNRRNLNEKLCGRYL